MATPIKWEDADFSWDNNSYTWDDVQLVEEVLKGPPTEELWDKWEDNKKKRLIKLILKVHGKTITESKRRKIKQYKITAKDIRIAVKEVLGAEMIAENVSI